MHVVTFQVLPEDSADDLRLFLDYRNHAIALPQAEHVIYRDAFYEPFLIPAVLAPLNVLRHIE